MRASSVRIRPVSADQEQPEQSFADAARATLERALAEGAVVLMVAWETPSGAVTGVSVPGSGALVRGLTEALYEALIPDSSNAD